MSLPLRQKVGGINQIEQAEYCSPRRELNEEFERGLRHNASDPWAEVIHLIDASIEFAAMMNPVQLVVEARAAEFRPAIMLAYEDVFHPEVLDAVAFGVCVGSFCTIAFRRVCLEVVLFF